MTNTPDQILDALQADGILTVIQVDPSDFRWHKGIPARDRFAYATIDGDPVKITHLTVLGLLVVENVDGQHFPTGRRLSVDVWGMTFHEVNQACHDHGWIPE